MSGERATTPEVRILDRVGVIVASRPRNVKPHAFIQSSRTIVRCTNLERCAPCAQLSRLGEHALHQRSSNAPPSQFRKHRDIVDVNLVDDQPEGTEADDGPLGGTNDEDVAHRTVLQFPRIHLPRPWIRERL